MENTTGLYAQGGCRNTVCAQCGYRFVKGDEALMVKETGDIIHKGCWYDYTDDNVSELTEEMEFLGGVDVGYEKEQV